MIYLRSLLFSIGMGLATVVFALLGLLTFPMPYIWRYRFIIQWSAFNLWWLKICCGISYQVEGLENIPQSPAIVMSKHQSTWETLAFSKIFPPQAWVLKRELFWVPFFGWGLALLQPIAINRGSGRKAMASIVTQGRERLDKGRYVIVFPEGTRMAPGARGRYGIGGAVLAESSGYPILPVAHNAGEFWPRRSFVKYPGIIRVVIGPAILPQGKKAEALKQSAEEWIENTMVRLNGIFK